MTLTQIQTRLNQARLKCARARRDYDAAVLRAVDMRLVGLEYDAAIDTESRAYSDAAAEYGYAALAEYNYAHKKSCQSAVETDAE